MAGKKILYISNVDLSGKFIPGVVEKIRGQAAAFRRAGFVLDLLYPTNDGVIYIETDQGQKKRYKGARPFYAKSGLLRKMLLHLRLAWYGSISFKDCENEILSEEYDGIYLRFYIPGSDLINFLERVRRHNKNILVLLEYPTLNIKQVLKGDWVRKFSYYINASRIEKLNKLADYIVTLTKDKTLFGKPAIFMANGFESGKISVLQPQTSADPFIILGVASDCAHYHGYDKVISGMTAYYRSNPARKVYFRIVSSLLGYNISALRKLVDENNLTPYVQFCGTMDRIGLEKQYQQAHVGMGTLALHRVGLLDNYSLKHREYAAFGLPFIMSKGDDVFEDSSFVLTVERDEQPLDISGILSFFDKLMSDYPDYPRAFRQFADERISWDTQLKNVFNVINTYKAGG